MMVQRDVSPARLRDQVSSVTKPRPVGAIVPFTAMRSARAGIRRPDVRKVGWQNM
jgi:hypothetical protein